jgi:iron complex transport system ATP-binding protein
MRNARVTAAGPISDVLTGTAVSDAFGLPVAVDQREGRWSARATPGGPADPISLAEG